MTHDPQSKSPDAGNEDTPSMDDKATVPPPAFYDDAVAEAGADELQLGSGGDNESDALLDVLLDKNADDASQGASSKTTSAVTPPPLPPRPKGPPRPVRPPPLPRPAPPRLSPTPPPPSDNLADDVASDPATPLPDRAETPFDFATPHVNLSADLGDEPSFEPSEPAASGDELPQTHEESAADEAVPSGEPLPTISPPTALFDNEQDANAGLVASGQRDQFAARAEWLRAEAEMLEDKHARARALLPVIELYAMVGEEASARNLADQVKELFPALVFGHRLSRWLLMNEGDHAATVDALNAETRVLGTPAARCHNALLAAEVARVGLSDETSAHKHVEQALRTNPSDPRAHVQRFCETLSTMDGSTEAAAALAKARFPDASDLAPLVAASAHVAAHRGAPPKVSRVARDAKPSTHYEALLRARASLDAGDVAASVTYLDALRSTELGAGISWLGAVLAAARKDTRPLALDSLRHVLEGSHGDLARRTLAALAIELGDAQAAQSAVSDASSSAFSAADRVVLSALSGGARDDVEPWIEALLGDTEFAPLSAAASAALSDPSVAQNVHTVGGIRARVAASLGRALARHACSTEASPEGNDAFSTAVMAHADITPESSIARALMLELDVDADRGGRVARAVSLLHSESDRDGALAGAILGEVAGETERAITDFDRARAADPQNECAARARAGYETGRAAARILTEHALALEEGPRAAVLLTEIATRLLDPKLIEDSDEAERQQLREEAEQLLMRAVRIESKLPIALHLGERSSRARIDRDALIEWLRTRREISSDPIEQAHDLVREALLVAESDPPAAAFLLEQALQARPQDIGLRELYERLAPESPADRAAWRADRARETSGVEAARLALEAALEFERAGDFTQAAACAQLAISHGDTSLGPIALYRAATHGPGAGELIDALIPQARATENPTERREIYERLAELDEFGRNDAASGLLWRRSILEETPNHLPTLRRIASTLITEQRDAELEPFVLEIARTLDGSEAVAHALVSARLRLRVLPWEDTREPVEIAYKNQPRCLWALRQMAAHARVNGEHALAIEAHRQLIERTDRPSEAAALSVRAAKDALLGGSLEDAVNFFRHAITLVPQYLIAHLELAPALELAGDVTGAAETLEAAAAASTTTEFRATVLYRAAVLWQDKVQNPARAREALEAIAAIDPTHADVFPRLQAIYIAEGARSELAALLERRLDAVTDPQERVEMEVLRGRALADVGDASAAKAALAAALDANPDHVEALSAFADVCARESDWQDAEQAWIRLARMVSEPAKQIEIYLRLGQLYDENLPNQERAELAYLEVLKRGESHALARERLVGLYKRSGDTERALEQQNILINAAEAPEEKCRRTAELAEIYEAAGDNKKAENTLLGARKAWPKDEFALASLARFYLRTDQGPAANVLLDRALADARRALNTGRFEAYLFGTVATVAELRSRPGVARISRATVAAIEGNDAAMGGAGPSAADPRFDDALAPDVMTPAFRKLLTSTGALLDTVVPFDLDSIRAVPLPEEHESVTKLVHTLATAYDLSSLNVCVTAALGTVCIPATSHPPTIVFGQALLDSPREDVRLFLIHRALKILQTNSSAFSRTAPIDLWPLLAAYLKALNPTWSPNVDQQARFVEFHSRFTQIMPSNFDPQLSTLAADVIGTIGNKAATLSAVVNGWGNHTALLALGDLNVALTGIAWSGGNTNAPPAQGKERLTWIGRNAEARDLIVFTISDSFADTRDKLGMGD